MFYKPIYHIFMCENNSFSTLGLFFFFSKFTFNFNVKCIKPVFTCWFNIFTQGNSWFCTQLWFMCALCKSFILHVIFHMWSSFFFVLKCEQNACKKINLTRFTREVHAGFCFSSLRFMFSCKGRGSFVMFSHHFFCLFDWNLSRRLPFPVFPSWILPERCGTFVEISGESSLSGAWTCQAVGSDLGW